MNYEQVEYMVVFSPFASLGWSEKKELDPKVLEKRGLMKRGMFNILFFYANFVIFFKKEECRRTIRI
jgi:hypothetical protein